AATTVVIAGTAGAPGDGRWPAGFPGSFLAGATWQKATVAERRSYVLGITDGLLLAAVVNLAPVHLHPPVPGAPHIVAQHVTHRVGGHLHGRGVAGDEPTLYFHVWDALVAMCRDDARN